MNYAVEETKPDGRQLLPVRRRVGRLFGGGLVVVGLGALVLAGPENEAARRASSVNREYERFAALNLDDRCRMRYGLPRCYRAVLSGSLTIDSSICCCVSHHIYPICNLRERPSSAPSMALTCLRMLLARHPEWPAIR